MTIIVCNVFDVYVKWCVVLLRLHCVHHICALLCISYMYICMHGKGVSMLSHVCVCVYTMCVNIHVNNIWCVWCVVVWYANNSMLVCVQILSCCVVCGTVWLMQLC